MCSFLGRNSSNDFLCLCHVFSSNPAFGHVAFHVVFAVHVSRVDTSLLQSGLNSLLYLFSFCLLDSNIYFLLLDFFRYAIFVYCNRVHGSNLHGNLLSQSFFNSLVESNNSAEAISVHVVINHSACTFYSHVTIQLHLLASDTATVCYSILYSTVAHRQSFYFVQSLALVSHGKVQNVLSQFHEISILSHEVSFALQSDDNGKVTRSLSQHTAFRSLAI